MIYPTGVLDDGIPADGIDVAFGPDVQKAIGDTLNTKCANPDECRKALSQVIGSPDLYLHAKRGVEALAIPVGAAIAGILAAAIQLNKQKSPELMPPKIGHLSGDELFELSEISQYAGDMNFALEGPDEDQPPMTVIVDPLPSLTAR